MDPAEKPLNENSDLKHNNQIVDIASCKNTSPILFSRWPWQSNTLQVTPCTSELERIEVTVLLTRKVCASTSDKIVGNFMLSGFRIYLHKQVVLTHC